MQVTNAAAHDVTELSDLTPTKSTKILNKEINSVRDITERLARRYLGMIGINKDQYLRNFCIKIINNIDTWPIYKSSRLLGYVQKGVIDLNLTSARKENTFSKTLFNQLKKNLVSNKVIVLFFTTDFEDNENVVHKVIYEQYPSVLDIKNIFDELVTDESFKMPKEYVETLKIKIMTLTDYNDQYDDFIDINFDKDFNEQI